MKYNRLAPILWSFAVSALVVGCSGASFYIEPEGATPTTLFKSDGIFNPDGIPLHVVIRTPEDWAMFLSDYPTRSKYIRDRFWRVDYDRHMVIGLVLGKRVSSSISVNIDSIRVEDHRLLVYATEHRPPSQRRDLVIPAHFVVVERMEMPVEFAEVVVKHGRPR